MKTDCPEKETLRLKRCNLNECEAICCYDGVSLHHGEDKMIRSVVDRFPQYFIHMPNTYITYRERRDGTKVLVTAVRHFEYSIQTLSKRFNSTKCVFSTDDHQCSLQVAAIGVGVHKWTFKPLTCWLFPLTLHNGEIVPLASEWRKNPSHVSEGLILPCENHHPEGDPWQEVFQEEIRYFEKFGKRDGKRRKEVQRPFKVP